MNRKWMFLLLPALLAGCSTREDLTSGLVGCPPNEVVITEGNVGWETATWTATCRSKTFYCTNSSIGGLTCAKELSEE